MTQVSGAVILLAAGQSERMGPGRDKLWMPLGGRPLLHYSLSTLASCPSVNCIVMVTRSGDRPRIEEMLSSFPKPWRWAEGGEERQGSVRNGLQVLPAEAEVVAVHDAARPFASCDLFCQTLAAAAEYGAAVAACPATDTIKEVVEGEVLGTLDRARLWQAQTPQAFRRALLQEAQAVAHEQGFQGTDDASLVERLGRSVRVVVGERWNIKITHVDDLIWAEGWQARRSGVPPMTEQRVGYGYDIHRFDPARPLWLGGVTIPDTPGLAGHSDADVLLHALCDALLGAASLGDIGHHFPTDDPTYQGIASLRLLERSWGMVSRQGWSFSNADLMVLAERPRLAPFLPAMRGAIAGALDCEEDRISIKATTHEGLGAIGAAQGIAAHAVVHLWRWCGEFHQGD